MTDDIRQQLRAQPFVPFTLHVADGREYTVLTTDHAHVHPGGDRVSIYTDDHKIIILLDTLLSGLVMEDSTQARS